MTYICFIESRNSSTPHMEPLMAEDLTEALSEAYRLMGQHTTPLAAHVFKEDQLIQTVFQDEPAA